VGILQVWRIQASNASRLTADAARRERPSGLEKGVGEAQHWHAKAEFGLE